MTLNQLRLFTVVARRLNVTEASKELHITQPAVSHELRLLEESIGTRLHKKIGRGIRLTEEGRRFLREAEALIAQFENLEKRYNPQLNGRTAESLTVGGSHSPSVLFLPSLLSAFKKSHPKVHLDLQRHDSRATEQMVLNGELDIAVVTSPSYSPFLVHEPCRREEIVLIASARHRLAKMERSKLARLGELSLVVRKRPGDKKTKTEEPLEQLAKRGIKVNVVMSCDSSEAVKVAVRNGVGLGFFYRDFVERDLRRGELKIVKIPGMDLRFQSFTVYRRAGPLPPTAEDFLTLLRQWRRRKRLAKQPSP